MKLAEALIERADCQKRLQQLRDRMLRSAKIQEGETPAEDPTVLLSELDRVSARLTDLIQRINRANSSTDFGDGSVLADALADRDHLARKRDILAALVDAASIKQDRYSRSEVKYISTVKIADLQKQVDDLFSAYRDLDSRIQELNWRTELK